ncbi:type II secretion system F family protein [Streptomyces sp. N35]|uniref:type II secretion system F family protein n=1 Tax=Streptomyces sp. N35 TaxID=2795730 RepID=UPI0027DB1293|nr:type II secretion system F family protein [Streptomyces sp. N35]
MIADLSGNLRVVLAALCGAVFGLGLWLIAAGAQRRPVVPVSGPGRWQRLKLRLPEQWKGTRLAAAVTAGVLVGALTGWPVAGVLTVVAVLTLPGLLGRDKATARRTERMEALALFTELLRDTLSAAAGLEQAILATADVAPKALGAESADLAAAIRAGRPLPEALRTFAREVDDPLGDMVVAALVMAAERQARQLATLLGELAETVREQVAMRQRIDAGRASVRTGVRVTVSVMLGMALGLITFNRPFLEPYDTAAGQLVLAIVGALFAVAFAWLRTIAHIKEPARLLQAAAADDTQGEGQEVKTP